MSKKYGQITETTVANAENAGSGENADDGRQKDQFSYDNGEIVTEDGLTLKQKAFVEAYLGASCMNSMKAYELAGYEVNNIKTARKLVTKLMHNPRVQDAIGRKFAAHLMNADWAKSKLASMANSSMANFLNEEGEFDMDKAARMGALDQIKEMEVLVDPDTGKVVRRKIKIYDRLQAMIILLRVLGVLTDRVKIEGDAETRAALHGAMDRVMNDPAVRDQVKALADTLSPMPDAPALPSVVIVEPEKEDAGKQEISQT